MHCYAISTCIGQLQVEFDQLVFNIYNLLILTVDKKYLQHLIYI